MSAGRVQPLAFLEERLEELRRRSLAREIRPVESAPGPHAVIGGRDVILLSSNNYLDLANDPRVRRSAARAAERFGAGTGGSRLTTGALELHEALEADLARFKGAEAALLFGTGHMANVGLITALCGRGDVIFSDALNHASIIDGCRQGRADVEIYAHNDVADLRRRIRARQERGGRMRGLVVTDSVFSMDGDIADVPALAREAHAAGLALVVDEAHATGVIGRSGRGVEEHFGLEGADAVLRPDAVVGTLSKALGSMGGFVCGSRTLIEWLRSTSRAFIFSTSLPAPCLAAARTALAILEAEPERVARLRGNVALLCRLLREGGVPADTPTAILPVVVGGAERALAAARLMLAAGCLAGAIRHPSVPEHAARLRVTLCSGHTEEDMAAAASALADALARTARHVPDGRPAPGISRIRALRTGERG